MRIPHLVWVILGASIVSAVILFGVLNAWKSSPVGSASTGKASNDKVSMAPIKGWLQITAESPVPPTKIEIFREGTLLAEMESPGFDSAQGGEFLFPPEGFALGVYARWEDFLPGPRAVRFTATFEGTEVSSFVLWGDNEEVSGVWKLPSIELAADGEEASEDTDPPDPSTQ